MKYTQEDLKEFCRQRIGIEFNELSAERQQRMPELREFKQWIAGREFDAAVSSLFQDVCKALKIPEILDWLSERLKNKTL